MAAATQELKNSIQVKLEQSGEYDRCASARQHAPTYPAAHPTDLCTVRRLKEHLRQKLIDSGWRDNLKEYTMRTSRLRLEYFAAPILPPHAGCRAICRAPPVIPMRPPVAA